ncbi:hypothetical protein BGZ65_008354 [Modicella reniformis]|uniref:Uncharacterized protein n=1 Tax=Modicella reniformis TaxID=1440133 RepID=A0A9P6SP41_9FUNG|nr:hypothetical protein BGZ65_008354 [Modicella reniformis]
MSGSPVLLQTKIAKSLLPNTSNIDISSDILAVENFIALNRMNGSTRKIVPMTSMELPFFTFNENDLIRIFWNSTKLKDVLDSRKSRQGILPQRISQVAKGSNYSGDGFRLQLLVFKLKVLNCVKYKRLRDELLQPRLTSTVGGVDYYLTEMFQQRAEYQGQELVVFRNLAVKQRAVYQPHFKFVDGPSQLKRRPQRNGEQVSPNSLEKPQ